MSSNGFNLARIRGQIKPFRLYWFSRLRSTNDHAVSLRKQRKLFAPAVVLTGRQVAGRGRGANAWWSGEGSFTATFVLPVQERLLPQQIPLLAGLTVRNVLADISHDESIQLKWPNDVLHDQRKLAGLLCERVARVDLIGVGINANIDPGEAPRWLRDRIASLQKIAGHPIDMSELLIDLARGFSQLIGRHDERPFGAALKEYDRHHALNGRRVTVQQAGEETSMTGTCAGLDSAGRLLLRSGGRSVRVVAGSVQMHLR